MSHFPYVQNLSRYHWMDSTIQCQKECLEIGHAVLVPFGKQKVSGYVIEFEETHLTTVRSISRILDPTPAFDRESIPFFKWIANYYPVDSAK